MPIIKGGVSILLLTLNTLVWGVPLIILTLLKVIVPGRRQKEWLLKGLCAVALNWIGGRVDRTIARSGPPQIRACAIDALGSSTVRFTRRTLGARFSLAVTGVSATVALPSPTGTILSVIAS